MNEDKFFEDLVRVSAMTGEQAGQWLGENFLRRLRRFETRGYVMLSMELVHDRDTSAPIDVVRPGDPLPDSGEIAYRADKRWKKVWTPKLIIRATAKLATIYGGEPRTTVTGHLSHDLALVDVLLKKRQADQTFEWSLVSSKPGGPLPDAISASGSIQLELVGRYNATSISAKMGLAAHGTIEFW
jgi:hypothetical protein